MTHNEKRRKTNKDMDYNNSSRRLRPIAKFKSRGLIYEKAIYTLL